MVREPTHSLPGVAEVIGVASEVGAQTQALTVVFGFHILPVEVLVSVVPRGRVVQKRDGLLCTD